MPDTIETDFTQRVTEAYCTSGNRIPEKRYGSGKEVVDSVSEEQRGHPLLPSYMKQWHDVPTALKPPTIAFFRTEVKLQILRHATHHTQSRLADDGVTSRL